MTGVSIKVDSRAVHDALNRLTHNVSDLRPAMDSIGSAVRDMIDLGFRAESDPYGNRWAPLSEVTQERRRSGRGSGSNKILRDTGVLANSMTYQAAANSVEIGTGVEYAVTHQFGSSKGEFGRTSRGAPIPWGDIPARPFLPEDDLPMEWEGEVLAVIDKHLGAGL